MKKKIIYFLKKNYQKLIGVVLMIPFVSYLGYLLIYDGLTITILKLIITFIIAFIGLGVYRNQSINEIIEELKNIGD